MLILEQKKGKKMDNTRTLRILFWGFVSVFSCFIQIGYGQPSPFASKPQPANEARGISLAPSLCWSPGDQVQSNDGHMVFLGTDPDQVAAAFYRNHPNVQVFIVSAPQLNLTDLKPETTYYWRVDQMNDAISPDGWKGPIWQFTTGTGNITNRFSDSFDTDHDYLVDNVDQTGWDGFLGKGPRQTADRIAAENQQLILVSTDGRYQEPWNPLGPLLYKIVNGDFKATVRIVDYQNTSYNNGGIMARAANLDDAGPGEDWISVDYFPIYGGIYGRMADDNGRQEFSNNGQGRNADKYLQLELIGNMFFLRHSPDGITWTELPSSPMTRPDLVNIPLQVGLFQATYSRNQGRVAFDDFALEYGAMTRNARAHFPQDGATNIPLQATLAWIPGAGAANHDVYFGSSYDAVKAAHADMAPGTTAYLGRLPVNKIDYTVSNLKDGQTYYWRVDEINDNHIERGTIWSFTTYNRALADFEHFKTSAALTEAWRPTGNVAADLATAAHSGSQALQLRYDTSASSPTAAVEYTFETNQDWMSSFYSFRWLSVWFKGNPDNQPAPLALVFEDNDWIPQRTIVPYDGDLDNLYKNSWTRWDIDLQTLVANNPAFRLHSVKKIAIQIGAPQIPAGKGSLCFDDLLIHIKRYDQNPIAEEGPRYLNPGQFVSAVPFQQVSVTGGLWRERMEINRTVNIPHIWEKTEYFKSSNGQESLRIDNFLKAAGQKPGRHTGLSFNDSDVYKIIEASAWSLQNHPDPELETYIDNVINAIAAAQWEDGYLFTHLSIPRRPEARWTNIGSLHELYCAGHLIESAVAYYKVTGKRKLLDVAIKFADLICDTFRPGKKLDPPGHQEIELALMKLYQLTNQQKYLDTAKFFIDQRGNAQGHRLYGAYSQDHIPFIQQEEGVGHSVRAGYMFCGASDIIMVNHDETYANALWRLWDDIANTKTYLTGGIGQPGGPEGFAGAYELGNNCYCETCSGIAFALWNHRLHLMTGETKYIDFMERTLLNNVLSSLSQDGKKHYYTNPLAGNGHQRWEWPDHDCACCPSNLARLIATIGGYAYTHHDNTVNVNLYLESQANIPLTDNTVTLTQATNYPWDGKIKIHVRPQKTGAFTMKLRIPGWSQNRPMPGNLYHYLNDNQEPVTLTVNQSTVPAMIDHGYITIKRTWHSDDLIHLNLPMPIRRVIAHPKVTADTGLVAIERGPIVYCAEYPDNNFNANQLKLPDNASLTPANEKDFYNGAVTISGETDPEIKLIPYYLHSNRDVRWMRVWMPR